MKRRRVAVIAVHGVADQKLGETAQTLAELLIARNAQWIRLRAGRASDEILHVDLVQPIEAAHPSPDGLLKKFRQSTGSDFLREGGTAAGKKRSPGVAAGAAFQGRGFHRLHAGPRERSMAIPSKRTPRRAFR